MDLLFVVKCCPLVVTCGQCIQNRVLLYIRVGDAAKSGFDPIPMSIPILFIIQSGIRILM